MAIVLGLIAAVAYGTSDFVAGLATKRSTTSAVTLGVQAVALVCALLVLPFIGGRLTGAAVGWGLLVAGPGSAIGSMCLYRGLASARMNVVAPLSGVVSAVIPAVVGLATGDRPRPLALAGIAIALVAIALVSLSPTAADTERSSGVPEGLGAGVGFGLLFIGLQRPGPVAGSWPLVCSEVSAVLVVLGFTLIRRQPALPARPAVPGTIVGGALVLVAALCYLLATRTGLLSVVAVLVSLYPALTVILAAAILHERSTRIQLAGMIAAVAAVSLITVS